MEKWTGPTDPVERLLFFLREEYLDERPEVRGDCAQIPRPCPYVSCRYHLFLDWSTRGIPNSMWWDRDPLRYKWSCSLDVADDGGTTLKHVGQMLNLTRERVRQIEMIALKKVLQAFREMGYTAEDVRAVLLDVGWNAHTWPDFDDLI